MSNDVERLAEVVHKHAGTWLTLAGAEKLAQRLVVEGVTLPTPPRATPLEAAARARCKRNGSTPWNELTPTEQRAWLTDTAEDITAAVGALSEEAIMADSQFPTPEGTEWHWLANRIRAAWLARLTEGGAR